MLKLSPAVVISLVALFVALSNSGIAGVGAKSKSVEVLGPTITITKSLPINQPSGFVFCPRGYQAVGGGYDSWRPPDYSVDYDGPAFRLPDGSGDLFRDTGEGIQRPADGWAVAAVRTQAAPAGVDAPLKAIAICAKVKRIKVAS